MSQYCEKNEKNDDQHQTTTPPSRRATTEEIKNSQKEEDEEEYVHKGRSGGTVIGLHALQLIQLVQPDGFSFDRYLVPGADFQPLVVEVAVGKDQ